MLVDLYERTTLRLAEGADLKAETASIVQRAKIKRACLNIAVDCRVAA